MNMLSFLLSQPANHHPSNAQKAASSHAQKAASSHAQKTTSSHAQKTTSNSNSSFTSSSHTQKAASLPKEEESKPYHSHTQVLLHNNLIIIK